MKSWATTLKTFERQAILQNVEYGNGNSTYFFFIKVFMLTFTITISEIKTFEHHVIVDF